MKCWYWKYVNITVLTGEWSSLKSKMRYWNKDKKYCSRIRIYKTRKRYEVSDFWTEGDRKWLKCNQAQKKGPFDLSFPFTCTMCSWHLEPKHLNLFLPAIRQPSFILAKRQQNQLLRLKIPLINFTANTNTFWYFLKMYPFSL